MHSHERGLEIGSVLAICKVFLHSWASMRKASGEGVMDKLTWTDQRKISPLARELYCLSSIEALSAQIVRRLHTLIEDSSVLVALEDIKTGVPSVLADNLGPDFQKLGPTMSALHHEHPGIRYHRSHPSRRAVAIADLLPLPRWRKTTLFNEVCSQLGTQDQLGAGSPISRSEIPGCSCKWSFAISCG